MSTHTNSVLRDPTGRGAIARRCTAVFLVASALLAVGAHPARSNERARPDAAATQTLACPPQDVEVGRYVQLESTCTWYADHGKGAPLVLLHGAVVDARWWDPNLDALSEHFHLYTPDLRGHGHTPDVEGPFTYEAFAQDLIEFLEAVVDTPATLVGHSTGSAAAMLVAMRRPDLVDRLVLFSSSFDSDGDVPGSDQVDVDAVVEFLGKSYGEVSPHGKDYFRVVVEKVADLSARGIHLEAAELRAIGSRTLVIHADDDIVTLEHAVEMYTAIPQAELAIVPGTSHFLNQEKPELVNTILLDFLTNDPVPTVAPIRRAQSSAVQQ